MYLYNISSLILDNLVIIKNFVLINTKEKTKTKNKKNKKKKNKTCHRGRIARRKHLAHHIKNFNVKLFANADAAANAGGSTIAHPGLRIGELKMGSQIPMCTYGKDFYLTRKNEEDHMS